MYLLVKGTLESNKGELMILPTGFVLFHELPGQLAAKLLVREGDL